MATIDDVRPLASRLPRSYEVLIRDRVKFRVGRIVHLAFSRDETVMGFAFPKSARTWPTRRACGWPRRALVSGLISGAVVVALIRRIRTSDGQSALTWAGMVAVVAGLAHPPSPGRRRYWGSEE